MKRYWRMALILVFLSPMSSDAGAPSRAKEGSKARLLSFDDVEKRLGAPGARILDVRPRADYDKGHIPGAVWVDAKAVEAMAAKPGALTNRDAWQGWIAPLGIEPQTEIVVYEGGRQLDAARLWWLLGYLGAENVALVNGNFSRWAAENRPVTTDAPKVEPRPFPVSFQKNRHATRDEVRAAINAKSAAVVDARSEGEYLGKIKRSQRGGHIPTACHLEWSNFVGADGRFLEPSELRAQLDKAGVKPDAAIITHCQGGGRASVNAFVLEFLGHPTRNYYLGWSDWGNAEDAPVEQGK